MGLDAEQLVFIQSCFKCGCERQLKKFLETPRVSTKWKAGRDCQMPSRRPEVLPRFQPGIRRQGDSVSRYARGRNGFEVT